MTADIKDMDELTRTLPKPLGARGKRLRPLSEQVMVITGASSGIGLTTARMAAKKGVTLVLAARNGEALQALVAEIEAAGGKATHVVADVGSQTDVALVAETARTLYGGFDTWVNNAGVSIFGAIDEVSIEDMQRMMQTNYWGVVYGSLEAVKHYKSRNSQFAGSIINVGSFFGDRATPLQSTYASAKHAVHGWTDALRMEMESERAPISVTLIHPGRIDTPYNEHAQSYVKRQPAHRDMIYPPEAVAEAILYAAAHTVRDMFVGSQSKALVVLAGLSPRLMDRFMERYMYIGQTADRPSQLRRESALHGPGYGLETRGSQSGWIRRRSYYVKAEKHRRLLLGALLGVFLLLRYRQLVEQQAAAKHPLRAKLKDFLP